RTLGEGHPDLAVPLVRLGALLRLRGEAEEAEKHLREGLEIWRRALPAGHQRIIYTEALLGACVAEQERHAEAIPLITPHLDTLRAWLGEDHEFCRELLGLLATAHEHQGNLEVAGELRERLEVEE
ncbi:MAG: tetratricopeptide repeat protein, partial [Planctomycetota bacterium]